MTRLTPDMISDVPNLYKLSYNLMKCLDMDLIDLAHESVGPVSKEIVLRNVRVGIVPMTCGQGIITGFSNSVKSIVDYLGMSAFVTESTDVAGITEAIRNNAEIIFMADDDQFIALNTHVLKYATNTECTALGYIAALRSLQKSQRNGSILVVGCGRIGSYVVDVFSKEYAVVNVFDTDMNKAVELKNRHPNVHVCADLESAVRENGVIFNASPGEIPGRWIQQGAVISSPGVPYSFDSEAVRKARAIIHDPLSIGVSVMAMMCASYSIPISKIEYETEPIDVKSMC